NLFSLPVPAGPALDCVHRHVQLLGNLLVLQAFFVERIAFISEVHLHHHHRPLCCSQKIKRGLDKETALRHTQITLRSGECPSRNPPASTPTSVPANNPGQTAQRGAPVVRTSSTPITSATHSESTKALSAAGSHLRGPQTTSA